MRLLRNLSIAGLVAISKLAKAETPAFDPRSYKGQQAGPPTQVLVLGTTHLSGLPDSFKPEYLAPLLDKLAAFKPDIITVENLSGQQCDMLLRYKADYPGVADDYCADTSPARAATGLDLPAAEHEVRTTLANWPAAPTAAQRRHLAALFAAAGDRPSAVVQWLRLPPEERRIGDGIDQALLEILTKAMTRRNESILVGATLAARLGLERVYMTDDHTSDSVTVNLSDAFSAAIQKVWSMPNAALAEYRARSEKAASAAEVMALYRYVNAPATQHATIDGDFGANLRAPTPELYGRQYVAWWEVRNLRMVANIRAAFGNKPGARVLSIVGSAHKGYFDAYLNMMHEVKLVDAEQVLK